jgi:hypothetical protein
MNQRNPFQIIRPTDEPPVELRKEVLGSVNFMMLVMRFTQLFVADYAAALFDKFRLVDRPTDPGTTPPDPNTERL